MIFLLFFIAVVYTSVGFGGGSMYLSVLSQAYPGAIWIRFPALLCNLSASSVGSMRYASEKLIPWKAVIALLSVSVPFAVWSSNWKLDKWYFMCCLGTAILVSGVALLFQIRSKAELNVLIKNPWWIYPIVGGVGIVSGITGIGGGIYLSPILHAMHWAHPKRIAATTSVFIGVNSLCSLCASYNNDIQFESDFGIWMAVVGFGAIIGSYFGVKHMSASHIKWITAVLLIIVGCKILIEL
jgi:uncharacterized protein